MGKKTETNEFKGFLMNKCYFKFPFSDFSTLFGKVHKDNKGVEGSKPRLERVPVCTCIQVTGLKVESSDDTIWLYFENEKRSGGKDVQMVERKWKDEALVFFEDPSSKKSTSLLIIDSKTLKRESGKC